MDPLSITASIIAILGATGTVGKGFKKLAKVRHVPAALTELREIVTDLRLLIECTSDLAREYEEVDIKAVNSAALRGLERIKDSVLDLEKLIIHDLTTYVDSNGETKIARLTWIRSQPQVEQVKSQIQADTAYLSASLQLVNASTSLNQIRHQRACSRVVEHVGQSYRSTVPGTAELQYHSRDGRFEDGRRIDGGNNLVAVPKPPYDHSQIPVTATPRQLVWPGIEASRSTSVNLIDHKSELSSLHHILSSPQGADSSCTDRTDVSTKTSGWKRSGGDDDRNRPAAPITSEPKPLNRVPLRSLGKMLNSSRGTKFSSADMLKTKLTEREMDLLYDLIASLASKLTAENASTFEERAKSKSKSQSRATCKLACQCPCHKANRLRTPEFLTSVIGSVAADYSIRPKALKDCVSEKCGNTIIKASYSPPTWLLNQRLEYFSSSGDMTTYISKLRPESDPIFWAARTGALVHMKRLFSSGQATLWDINRSDGKTVLHMAVDAMNLGVIKFLLQQGADPSIRCSSGHSALTAARTLLLTKTPFTNQHEREALTELFDLNAAHDDFDFTPIHLACIFPADDASKYQLAYSSLDDEDAHGRTSLSWVAHQGNEHLTNLLLTCQADPNKADASGRAPLHWAIVARNARCVGSLIAAGADVFAKDNLGVNPIQLAVQGDSNLDIVQLLLSSGADIKARDGQGMMPLHLAAYYDQPSLVSRLLANGAGINDTDATGRTALLIAMSLNNYGVIRLLLNQRSLDCTVTDNHQRGLLHFAACLADTCTLGILGAATLHGIVPHERDDSGIMGIQYAQWRLLHNQAWSESVIEPQDPDPWEWYLAFRTLNANTKRTYTGCDELLLEDEDPTSWDALQRDVAALALPDDDDSSLDGDQDEEWTDAPDVPTDGCSA